MFRRAAVPLRRRLVAMLVALPLAVTGALVTTAIPADAAYRAFSQVFASNTAGDILLRGNTLMTCPAGSTSGSTTCAQAQNGTGAAQTNNTYAMTYVDTDSDSSTFDSSSSTVTIPAGGSVLYALLTWGGDTAGSTTSGLTGVNAPNASAKNVASFKVPGASSYTTVTSTQTDTNGSTYQGSANVTSAVQAAGSGSYTVANVQAGTGGNVYAGWALTVAYSDPTQPTRNLVIYSGFQNVASGNTVDIPVSGFTTPTSGNVVTRLGVVAWEGDKGTTGDGMSLNSTAISNTLNPSNDVFNSSETDLNTAVTTRTPSYTNLMAVDIDRFDASNILANGATSATIHLTTSNDSYYPGVVTFATNLYAPTLVATKTATDVNGGNLNRGDQLNYSIGVTNSGLDASTATVLTDAVPTGTTYVPGSLTIGGTAVTDAAGDDAGNVSGSTITARLGSGATASAGGSLAVNGSTTVAFAVTVNNADTDGTVLSNQAALAYTGSTTGAAFTGVSNTVTSAVVVPPTLTFGTLPGGEVNAAYSSQLTKTDGTGPFVWSVSSGSLPAGVTLNASTGLLSGTPTAAGTATFTVQVTDTNGRSDTRATSIVVVAGPGLTFAAPPTGEVNTAYSATSSAAGGTAPYGWSVSSGTLPSGVTLNTATGTLSGTPTVAGTYPITLTVTDAQGQTDSKTGTITVIAGPAITSAAPASGEINTAYSTTFTADGGSGGYVWSTTGTLPAGLTLNTATGVLSGTPSASGSSTFTVIATDSNGQPASRSTTIVIIPGPGLTYAAPPTAVLGSAYSVTLTASGGTTPYAWSTTGTLPAGITLDPATGVLSGTPTATGTSTFTVTATDANGQTASRSTSVTVASALTLSAPTPPTGELTVGYSLAFTAANGTSPYSYAVTAGTLPAGLTLDTSSGVVSGTPTAAGTRNFSVTATDSTGQTATVATTITVVAGPSAGFTTLLGGEVNTPYSVTLTATGGVTPYAWSISSGSLPTGLSLNSSTGVLSGTPTAAGSASFTVLITDANGLTASRSTGITIVAGPSFTFTAPANAQVGTAVVDPLSVTGGTGPYTWSVTSGSLPAGLSLASDTGLLSGTPTAVGTTAFTVGVTDANGQSDARNITFVVGPATASVSLTSASSVNFGSSITLTATVSPASATGTVTFSDVPARGLSAVLGTGTISGGVATISVPLPNFGTHVVTAVYSGDSSDSSATSSTDSVEVTAYTGEVIVREFRSSGPGGATDSYVELYNTGPAVPMAGFVLGTSASSSITLPSSAGILGTGRSYLVTGSQYSLAGVTPADDSAVLGTTNFAGVKVLAPDTSATRTDAVGNALGFHTGTALATLSGNPAGQWAWVRLESAGVVKNTGSNAADFKLVSTTGGSIGGVQSALGSPAPLGSASPYQQNAVLQSTLFDVNKGPTAGPNFYYTAATKTLTIRRTITNSSGSTITKMLLRITSMSEANGAPQPLVSTQPSNPALMRLQNPTAPSEGVILTSGTTVKVQNVSVQAPATASPGGGQNTTMNVPLGAGLAPGASVSVAFRFQVDSGSIWWFVYDVDALSSASPAAQQTMRVLARPGPAEVVAAGRVSGAPARYAGGSGTLR